MSRHALAAILLVLVPALRARAEDRVVLREGGDVFGHVESRTEGVIRVRTSKGVVSFAEKDIVRVEHLPDPELFGDGGDAEAEQKDTQKPAPAAEPPKRDPPKQVERDPVTARIEIEDGAEVRVPVRKPLEGAPAKLDDDDPRAGAIKALLAQLGSDEAEERAAATKLILDAWPETSFVLDVALSQGSDQARLEAVYLLREPALGDQTPRLTRALADKSNRVTIAALRAIRSLGIAALEEPVLRLLDSTAAWTVRQDAARTLERIGGPRTFPVVVALWAAEPDETRRNRLKRVMREIARVDLGDDPDVWQTAVGEAFMGRRALRDPGAP